MISFINFSVSIPAGIFSIKISLIEKITGIARIAIIITIINVNNGSIYFNQIFISFPFIESICGINLINKPDKTTIIDSNKTT
jgi:hypothetical protein